MRGEKFQEECGIFGVFPHPEAANITYLGLHALQHRGQESAGIAASDGAAVHVEKAMGLVADVFTEARLRRLGPLLEHHPLFPNRINVQFARVVSRGEVAILIWERGAGYTLASGTSACAVAAASVKNGLTDRRVTVESPGGELSVSVGEGWDLTLTGPASEICRGTLSQDMLRGLST